MPESSSYISFKSSDYSGSVAGLPRKKQSREQGSDPKKEEEKKPENQSKDTKFVDRSEELRGSLDALAMSNAIKVNKRKP